MSRTIEYSEYMNSKVWRKKREMLFLQRGKMCEWCGTTEQLEVHHRHYLTLGNERLEDLEIVCVWCHPYADAKREYNDARDTYLTKKYGDRWDERSDVLELMAKFDVWLKRKRRQSH